MAESPGFTGLGAPSLPGFPISPLPGQCINSQPWLLALTHRVAPYCVVARGAGSAGPVLLACRQWDPLGLARMLPSLGVGAWRNAPLLPWLVQCPVRVCAALAASSGSSGRYLVLCLSRFPHPVTRVLRCVWRAVPSGCPLSSLAGTPFHAVCAFRDLGLVALLVVPACPLRVCALALPQRAQPPPWVVWRAHLARSRHRALVGPFHVVRAPPRVLPRSLAPCGVLGGGGGLVPVPPYMAWGCCCEGRLRSGAPPPLTARPLGGLLGSATHVLWARVCGCGGPTLSPWPACPVGAACRGGGVVGGRPWWGVVCHCCEGRLVSGAVPPLTARPLGRAAGVPRPVCSGCGRCGCGDLAPAPGLAPLRAGVARRGGGRRASPGGVLSAVVRCVWGQALPLSRLPAPWAGCRGPLPTGCRCRWLRAWGPVTNPTARALASWLCAVWGRHEGARGGRLLPGSRASGVGRSPNPDCPPSGRAAGAHYPLAVGAGGCGRWDPSPTPKRALLRAGFARCGGSTRAPGGGTSCLGVGRPGSGALSSPTARPLGGLPGPTTHWLWVRGVAGVGTRHQPHSVRSCALWGRHEGARGGRLLPGCGASGVGRSPTPDCPPSGRAAGAHYPLAVGAGGCGR